jgi:uncharacterized protein
MFKILLRYLLLACCLLTVVGNVFSQDLPARPDPPRLVNDFTNTLTPAQIEALEKKLVTLDDSTSTQIAVVIIKTLNGYDIADYNVKLGRAWGVGDKKFNNGVVLLIAKDDRKLNIATGYGLEGALPDITCKHIIEDRIVPNFKADDYYHGIDEGTDAIIKAVKGEYQVPRKKHRGKSNNWIGVLVFVIIMLALFSGGRGGGGSYTSRRGVRRFGSPFIFFPTGGGSRGGGWSGGGGGFGGFGGGSFGGGGASGSW